MNEKRAQQIIKNVRDSYEKIADHFSQTRYRDWPEFAVFKNYIRSGDKVLDAGCGNGRLYDYLSKRKINYCGADFSLKLIALAKKKYPDADFRVADLQKLPFTDNYFNVVISVATLHHIPTRPLQGKVINGLARVLKKNGYLIITVWNLKQEQFQSKLQKLPVDHILTREKTEIIDLLWPWKNAQGQVLAKRYLHSFDQAELTGLVADSGFKIIKSFYSKKGSLVGQKDGYNLCLIARKVL